jgi:ABC-type uncharacterized transport system YnjBCD ATPase subunit
MYEVVGLIYSCWLNCKRIKSFDKKQYQIFVLLNDDLTYKKYEFWQLLLLLKVVVKNHISCSVTIFHQIIDQTTHITLYIIKSTLYNHY